MTRTSGGWPVRLNGVTESVVTTKEPGGTWNGAALGLFPGDPVRARTWGDTRTRRNFHRESGGVIQFTRDPVLFVEAALGIVERDRPVIEEVDAWVEVAVEQVDIGEQGGTSWEEWAVRPIDSSVNCRVVPTVSRGFNAVVEASVIASRLDVEEYDTDASVEYLGYLREVVARCGREVDQVAFRRLDELSGIDR